MNGRTTLKSAIELEVTSADIALAMIYRNDKSLPPGRYDPIAICAKRTLDDADIKVGITIFCSENPKDFHKKNFYLLPKSAQEFLHRWYNGHCVAPQTFYIMEKLC